MENRRAGQRNIRPVHPEGKGSYEGRFGHSGSSRPTGSYRSRPSGDYRSRAGFAEQSADVRRKSSRSGGDSYTRRPSAEDIRRSRARRAAKKREQIKRIGLAALMVLAVAVVFVLLILLLGGGNETIHHLPTVERMVSTLSEAV